MAYDIFDSNGHVSHGPSVHGLHELKQALNAVADAQHYPQVNMFFRHGYATTPIRFRSELGILMSKVSDESVKKSIQTLIDAAAKCKEIVILRN